MRNIQILTSHEPDKTWPLSLEPEKSGNLTSVLQRLPRGSHGLGFFWREHPRLTSPSASTFLFFSSCKHPDSRCVTDVSFSLAATKIYYCYITA
jgi:hypothetical protein